MQIEDFVRVYQAKSDEELIQLAAAPEHLTSEARVALQGELSRRRISVAEDSSESQNNGVEQVSGKAAPSSLLAMRFGRFCGLWREALTRLHTRFWRLDSSTTQHGLLAG
jgi:hypothetical protein